MALLVLLAGAARTRIVTSDLAALSHERLRFRRGCNSGFSTLFFFHFGRKRRVVFRVLIAHIVQLHRLFDRGNVLLAANLHGHQNARDFVAH